MRDALLDDAKREAEATLDVADRETESAVSAARTEAENLLAASRREGAAEARRAVDGELAQARRRGREVVFAARHEVYEHLRQQIRRAAADLRDTPDHTTLVEALTQLARRQLGSDAVVTVDSEVGGVVASAGGRSVDYRLPEVAERHLEEVGGVVEQLWR